MIQARAKERMKEYHGNQYENAPCQKSDKVQSVDTKKELAKIAGVSHDTIEKVHEEALSLFKINIKEHEAL